MSTTILLSRRQLLAALCTAGKTDIRKYLNGVRIEGSRICATDGKIASVQRILADSAMVVTIPHAVVALLKSNKSEAVELSTDGTKWAFA